MVSLDFYFDFSSPYGYFASHLLDRVAPGDWRWQPILLGAAFKASGNAPLVDQPMKGDYARRDWDRLSRQYGIPYTLPTVFPVGAVAPSRAFWWLDQHDAALARRFAQLVFHAYFAAGQDITAPQTVADLAAQAGADGAAVLSALGTDAVKQMVRAKTDAALARGVFGSPFFLVGDEPFWGCDRLPMVAQWMRQGGW